MNHIRAIQPDVKQWISNNIEFWMVENAPWFKIEMIHKRCLPDDDTIKTSHEAGVRGRRSSFSLATNGSPTGSMKGKVAPDAREESPNGTWSSGSGEKRSSEGRSTDYDVVKQTRSVTDMLGVSSGREDVKVEE